MVAAGLPNITGWANVAFATDNTSANADTDTKLFSSSWKNKVIQNGTDRNVGNLTFNAQKYNPIYGNSNTVTPLTYTVRAYICYA